MPVASVIVAPGRRVKAFECIDILGYWFGASDQDGGKYVGPRGQSLMTMTSCTLGISAREITRTWMLTEAL